MADSGSSSLALLQLIMPFLLFNVTSFPEVIQCGVLP
jgi:hypothetical protein